MKKYNLFKIILITIGIIALLTWFIPVSEYGQEGIVLGGRIPIGIWQIFNYFVIIFQYMAAPMVLILMVGGFYGVLNKTGVYTKLVEEVAETFKGLEKMLLVIITIIFAIITSFTGLSLPLFFLFPFVISILLIVGFDRMTILATTVGSVLVGIIGSTYANKIVGNINGNLSLSFQTELLSRLFLLIISLFLLIVYILSNQKMNKLGKNYEDPLYFENKSSKKKNWPVITVMALVVLIMLLSSIAWESAFGIEWFTNAHTNIMEYELFSIAIFREILGNIAPFGSWSTNEFSVLIAISSIIIALIYKIKFDNALDGFIEGTKKVLPIAFFVGLVHLAFMITSNHLYFFTLIDWLLNITNTFNIITLMLVIIIGSVLTVDIIYLAGIIPIVNTIITDTAVYPVMGVLIQSIYGLTMFVAPTSVMLVIGLYYLDIPFNKWIKYIFRYAIQLLIVITIMLTLIVLI